MGHGIAQVFMIAGFDTHIWDPSESIRSSIKERISDHLKLMQIDHPVDLTISETLESCVSGSDLVVEAIPEKMELKKQLIKELDDLSPSCLIATNTSVLRITEIARDSKNPSRVVGTHWWNPPYLIPVVEVVRGEQTSESTASKVSEWLVSAGKKPVDVYKDVPGFVGSRMMFALMREAAYLVEQGICSPETVDLVANLTFGRRLPVLGPLRNADFIGLDLVCDIMNYVSPSLCNASEAPTLFKEKIAEGKVGAKSGSGIYSWTDDSRRETESKLIGHLLEEERLTKK